MNLKGGSSRVKFVFSSIYVLDIVGSVELDGDGKAVSVVGGSETKSWYVWKSLDKWWNLEKQTSGHANVCMHTEFYSFNDI